MKEEKYYESFPAWIAIVSALFTLAIFAIGVYILGRFGIVIAIVYMAYCIWVELRVLSKSCVHCVYYGRVCGLGKSVVCALLFKKGDPEKFSKREISWKDVVPDFLVSIFPLLAGIVLFITDFSWTVLFLWLVLLFLAFAGTALLRGSLTCKYCMKRLTGCPAEQLFNKQKTRNAQRDP